MAKIGNSQPVTAIARTDVIPFDGEYVEAEVIEEESIGQGRLNKTRFVRPLAAFFMGVFAVSMIGGFVGGGAINTVFGAVNSLVMQFAGDSVEAETYASIPEGTPVGTPATTSDGLLIRCDGSYLQQGKGINGANLVVVTLEVENAGTEKIILRKGQFAALASDGSAIEAVDQTLSRGNSSAYYQFTSVTAEPGEHFIVCSTFYETTSPDKALYRPYKHSKDYDATCTTLEIEGMPEAVLA